MAEAVIPTLLVIATVTLLLSSIADIAVEVVAAPGQDTPPPIGEFYEEHKDEYSKEISAMRFVMRNFEGNPEKLVLELDKKFGVVVEPQQPQLPGHFRVWEYCRDGVDVNAPVGEGVSYGLALALSTTKFKLCYLAHLHEEASGEAQRETNQQKAALINRMLSYERHYRATHALSAKLDEALKDGEVAANISFIQKDRENSNDEAEFEFLSTVGAYNGALPDSLNVGLLENQAVVETLAQIAESAFIFGGEKNPNVVGIFVANLERAPESLRSLDYLKEIAKMLRDHERVTTNVKKTSSINDQVQSHLIKINEQLVMKVRDKVKEVLGCLATAYHQQKLLHSTLDMLKQAIKGMMKVNEVIFQMNPEIRVH